MLLPVVRISQEHSKKKTGKKFDVIPLQHHVTLSHHCT